MPKEIEKPEFIIPIDEKWSHRLPIELTVGTSEALHNDEFSSKVVSKHAISSNPPHDGSHRKK
jgi:hypothetical protein